MAVRSLAFGVRLRDGGRTLRVRRSSGTTRGYVVEDGDGQRAPRRRDHVSLEGALRDVARARRARLH